MIPIWLHFLAIVCLVTGLICAVWIAIDETRHPQHMWIMNLVWRITPALRHRVCALVLLRLWTVRAPHGARVETTG